MRYSHCSLYLTPVGPPTQDLHVLHHEWRGAVNSHPTPKGLLATDGFLGCGGSLAVGGGHFLHWCSRCHASYAVNKLSESHTKGRRESGRGTCWEEERSQCGKEVRGRDE